MAKGLTSYPAASGPFGNDAASLGVESQSTLLACLIPPDIDFFLKAAHGPTGQCGASRNPQSHGPNSSRFLLTRNRRAAPFKVPSLVPLVTHPGGGGCPFVFAKSLRFYLVKEPVYEASGLMGKDLGGHGAHAGPWGPSRRAPLESNGKDRVTSCKGIEEID
jgi:hypothetical protein